MFKDPLVAGVAGWCGGVLFTAFLALVMFSK